MNLLKRKLKIGVISTLATVALFGSFLNGNKIIGAQAQDNGTVNIRIIATTDLHGQIDSKDYEQGVTLNNLGLAKAFNVIKNARSELPKANSITLDAGDILYDFTTEYIYSTDQNEIQPIYKALAKVGYDAITLGNHDFDYGYDYILRQLSGSGMKDVTVVSNVADSKTGKYPFNEYKLIKRKVKTSTGKVVEIKIGIIGQTIPTLTTKTQNYVGILKTEDMVLNAQTEAKKLKKMGADIVVALSHTGIGPEKPALNYKNEAYALSKIPEVDVVVCGHEHGHFPSKDMTSTYYRLPNVSKKTGLMNGKNVVMAGNRGSAVGVVDLKLEINNDSSEIVDRSSEIRMVSDAKVEGDSKISASYGKWADKLSQYGTKVIGHLNDNEMFQNYFGLIEDNPAIQILNDSKINYAQRYVNTTGTKYKKYPIIAASTYYNFGTDSMNNYIKISGDLTDASITEIQPYNNYLYIYKITGKQLKEWLEWSASAYETVMFGKEWNDGAMLDLMKKTSLKPLIREDWLDDWGNFYIFDGINYVIDPYSEPRYDISGNKISDNVRVKNITYNGTAVTDKTVLLVATNKVTHPVTATKGVDKYVVKNGFNRSQLILSDYIKQIAVSGSIFTKADDNWRVDLPTDYQFIMKTPNYADDLVKATSWYRSFIEEQNQYCYYIAGIPEVTTDTKPPHIVITPVKTNPTASPYDVAVQAYDSSEIKQLLVLSGEYDVNNFVLSSAKNISNNIFTVYDNGIFTIYAEDLYGNKTVKKLVINNFNKNMLSSPTVNTYTNRKTKITGTAEPGTTIVFEAFTGTYESKVPSTGNYSYELPSQPSDTTLTVFIKDTVKGLESEHVSLTVRRTGPNQPSVFTINNNSDSIMGRLNDEDASAIAIIGENVYVSNKGGKALWQANTEIYNKKYKVIEVKEYISDTGYYKLMIPSLDAGKAISIYTLDHVSRNSRVVSTKVIEAAPNTPVLYEISNIEKDVYGYITGAAKKSCDVTLTIGKQVYQSKTDEEGKFTIHFTSQLHVGEELTVIASDSKEGVVRKSLPGKVAVRDIEDFVKAKSSSIYLNRVTNKSNFITGYYEENEDVYLAVTAGKGSKFKNTMHYVKTDTNSRFVYQLSKKLKVGYTIYAMARFTDGKILLANKTVVIQGIPDKPSLVRKISNKDKTANVISEKDCKVTVKIGSKTYTTSKYEKGKKEGQYIYTLNINRASSGIKVSISSKNACGTSDPYTLEIVKKAPDKPEVNVVHSGDKVITGKVELFDGTVSTNTEDITNTDDITNTEDTINSEDPTNTGDITNTENAANTENTTNTENTNAENPTKTDTTNTENSTKTENITNTKDTTNKAKTQKEKIPEKFKNSPANVAKTQTRIFAQIGKKIYEGTISNNGNLKIKIPAQKSGTVIYIWGSNKSGRGPLEKIIVI